MAFVQSGKGSRTYIKLAECEDNQILVDGYYVGFEPSSNPKFKGSYIFRQKSGDVVGLNAMAKLDKWINEGIAEGDRVGIIYLGKIILDSGKNKGLPMQDFDFYTDSEDGEDFSQNLQAVADQLNNPSKPAVKTLAAKPTGKVAAPKSKTEQDKFAKFADEAL